MLKGCRMHLRVAILGCMALVLLLFASCGVESVAEHESRMAEELSQFGQSAAVTEESSATQAASEASETSSVQLPAGGQQGGTGVLPSGPVTQAPAPGQQPNAAPGAPEHKPAATQPPKQDTPPAPSEVKKIAVALSVTCTDAVGDTRLPGSIQLPSDGILLKQTTVTLQEGQSVFRALELACAASGTPLVSQSSMFGAYVQRIGPIGEKDCGPQSGWKYKVNGVTPGMASDAYQLKNGDTVEWYYATKV